MARHGKMWVLVVVLALVAAGCGDDAGDGAGGTTTTGGSSSTTGSATRGEATQLTVVAEDFSFSGVPEQLQAGVLDITFENSGQLEHELAFVEIGDTPLDEVGTALAPTIEGGPFPDFLENLAIPLTIPGGETAQTSALLAAGNYALICALTGARPEPGATTTTGGGPDEQGAQGPPHYELGMIQPVTVTGDAAQLSLPQAESTVTARDYAFDVDVSAGRQTVNFTNQGPEQVHHGVFFAFREGVDEAAAESALRTLVTSEDEEAPPPPEIDIEATEQNFGIFSTGLGASYDAEFEAGRTYAVVCFIQDRAGGPPHLIAHDMKEIFTVQ
ncbi:MAG: hypothetical protein KY431_03080 [Actinobacteria bacterium]|nr:hypothetical protein [Actinomycetota bacterium]